MAKVSLTAFLRDRFEGISRFAVNHARLTVGFWIAIAVAGLLAFSSLKYALFPDFTFPLIIVNAMAPTATAGETETTLTNPIEAALQDLEGVVVLRSTTTPGRSLVTVEYDIGLDIDASADAVQTALDSVTLPLATTTQLLPFNINEAVAVSYALLAEDLPLSAIADRAEADIVPALQGLPGVLRVELLGTGVAAVPDPTAATAAIPQTPSTLVQWKGASALAVQVVKQAQANTLEVVAAVEAKVADLQRDFPDIQFVLATTQADYIKEATQATISALWQAIALAVLVIFAFLRNWRATLITAVTIPLSLLTTAIVMAISGFNLETITLLALALVIGIIVDDAIVEVENIIRHLEAGEPPRQAALNASAEIGLTVSVSTLTIVAVFLPVALMGGTVGQFFKPFGLTVSAAVIASLLIARTLVPVLAVYWLRPSSPQEIPPGSGKTNVSPTALEPATRGLIPYYNRLLQGALHRRGWVIGGAIASFAIGMALIPYIPQGFIPKLDRGEFTIAFTTPLPELPTRAPQPPAVTLDGAPAPSDLPVEAGLPPAAETEVAVPDLPGTANAAALTQGSVNPLDQLLEASRQIAFQLEQTVLANENVAATFTTVGGQGAPNQGQIYVKLADDRRDRTATVQDQMRRDLPMLPGVETSVKDILFIDTGDEKPLQVTLLSPDLVALNQAAQRVQAQVAALPGFVDVTVTGADNTATDITEINHLNGERVATLSANLSAGQALGDATQQVVALAKAEIPDTVRLGLAGDSARIGEVLGSFLVTLGLGVVCMLGVLFLPFGRLLEPAVVGLALPLAIVGSMVALLVTQSDFGMVSVIGLLFLLGLLDKNALLLMDYINQLRQTGLSRTEAILQTGRVRLRPILMTTASTILGMLPIAFGLGAGAELRQPMAVAIIGGLATSTLLSLLLVPVLYVLLEDAWIGLTKGVRPSQG